MNKKFVEKQVQHLLISLVLLDLLLSIVGLFFPQFWFTVIHGTLYVDPAGLFRRTGAIWLAFFVFQAITLVQWKKQPFWLLIVAGLRLSELFADWTYLLVCSDITMFGRVALLGAAPLNAWLGWVLIKYYHVLNDSKSNSLK